MSEKKSGVNRRFGVLGKCGLLQKCGAGYIQWKPKQAATLIAEEKSCFDCMRETECIETGEKCNPETLEHYKPRFRGNEKDHKGFAMERDESTADQLEQPSDKQYLNNLVAAHWSYINQLLEAHGTAPEQRDAIGFHYKTAFEHGWKHALEYQQEK